MRKLASKLRDQVEDAEENMVEVRRDDRTIRDFIIPTQDVVGALAHLTSVRVIHDHEPEIVDVDILIRKGDRVIVSGPNGIGKSTLLEKLASGHAKGEHVKEGVKIGYYRQDFSTLDFNATVYQTLAKAMGSDGTEQGLRGHAAGFLLDAEILKAKVGSLSEGQKGLVAFAALSLEKPGLLILDEPTNHINFRHIPVIAKAINNFEGAMILISHVQDFVEKIRVDFILDLGAL